MEKIKYFLPTYDECVSICEANDNLTFYESKHLINGYNVSTFNYRLSPKNFKTPMGVDNGIVADENRGITFVFNSDGSLYSRYLLLHKFWNMNQVEESMYSVLKNYTIRNVMNKEDGSIISFIKLPNNVIVAKSKNSFESDQALDAQKIYDNNESIRNFVKYTLDNNIIAIFEYVSPNNMVVVPYSETKLILLKLRCNLTGEYLDIKKYLDIIGDIEIAKFEDYTNLDQLVELQKTITDKEGWIVEFENGYLTKVKCDWYCERHNLYFMELHQENTILSLILSDTIDDVLGQLDIDDVRRDMISELTDTLNNYFLLNFNDVKRLYSLYDGNRKEFASKYIKEYNFSIASKMIDHDLSDDNIYERLKYRAKQETYWLQKAREWVKKWSTN